MTNILPRDANLQSSRAISGKDTMELSNSANPPSRVGIQEFLLLVIGAGRISV